MGEPMGEPIGSPTGWGNQPADTKMGGAPTTAGSPSVWVNQPADTKIGDDPTTRRLQASQDPLQTSCLGNYITPAKNPKHGFFDQRVGEPVWGP